MTERTIVEEYFAAMRRGAAAEAELTALLADDVVYVEPFSGDGPAIGKDEVLARFRRGWEQPLPDMQLDIRAIEIDATTASATWECRSPALPGPVIGEDAYEIENGKITRLEVRIVTGP